MKLTSAHTAAFFAGLACASGLMVMVWLFNGSVTKQSALDIADATIARELKIDLQHYNRHASRISKFWIVHYSYATTPGELALDANFTVQVSRITGDAVILPNH